MCRSLSFYDARAFGCRVKHIRTRYWVSLRRWHGRPARGPRARCACHIQTDPLPGTLLLLCQELSARPVPAGDEFNSRWQRHRIMRRMIRPTLKALIIRPLRGRVVFGCPYPWALPTATQFHAFGVRKRLPARMNLPLVHNVLAFKHVVVGMLSGGQTRMICQNSHARPNPQTVEGVIVLHH